MVQRRKGCVEKRGKEGRQWYCDEGERTQAGKTEWWDRWGRHIRFECICIILVSSFVIWARKLQFFDAWTASKQFNERIIHVRNVSPNLKRGYLQSFQGLKPLDAIFEQQSLQSPITHGQMNMESQAVQKRQERKQLCEQRVDVECLWFKKGDLRNIERLDPSPWSRIWYPPDGIPLLVRSVEVRHKFLQRRQSEDVDVCVKQWQSDILMKRSQKTIS